MSLPMKAEVLGSQQVHSYQPLWMVYPEILAGYVGVSCSTLEFVSPDKRRLKPPFTETIPEKYIHV